MLTSDQSIVLYEAGRAIPDRLTRRTHAQYLAYAERMLDTYRRGVGRTRRELHRAVEALFADEPDCESRRIRAFSKLLDDAGEFASDPRGRAAKLRLQVFGMAAKLHPLVAQADRLFEHGEAEAKEQIARELGRPWPEIEAGLYADVLDFQKLTAFPGYESAEAFLSRYNVAQVQACLYRAERMAITATRDFKTILRYAHLAQLLLDIRRIGGSAGASPSLRLPPAAYRIELSGPASVLRETRRYGVAMAKFLPALLACDGWELEAVIRTPWGTRALLTLTSRDGLRSHLPAPEEFDSSVEEAFAARFGEEREGWRLFREAEIVHEGQTAFVPDFAFRHTDGTEVLFEIVGFWTPDYLERKREILRRFRSHRVLLAVSARSLEDGVRLPEDLIVYKTVIRPETVLDALERIRAKRAAKSEDGREG